MRQGGERHNAEITAGAQIPTTVCIARVRHNGVNRHEYGLVQPIQIGYVDDSKGTNGLLGLFIAVDRLGIDVQQGCHLSMTASPPGAADDLFALQPTASKRGAAAVGGAALPALALP